MALINTFDATIFKLVFVKFIINTVTGTEFIRLGAFSFTFLRQIFQLLPYSIYKCALRIVGETVSCGQYCV